MKNRHAPDKMISYWLNEKRVVSFIIFFGLTFNAAVSIGPILQGKLIDALVQKKSLSDLLIYIGVYVLTILLIQTARFFKRFYVRRFSNLTTASMRSSIYQNFMNKTLPELEEENTGNLMTRVISDVDLCAEGMRKVTTEVFDTGVLMLSYLVSMLYYDVKLTILSCLFIPIAMFCAEKLKTVIYQYSLAYRRKTSDVTDFTYHCIENALLYRVNGMEELTQQEYQEQIQELKTKAIKANILENSMEPIYKIIALCGIIFVVYLGGEKVLAGTWSIGAMSAYLTMFIAISGKASRAARLFNSAQKANVSWLRIKPYLKAEDIETEASASTQQPVECHSLTVTDLSFSYGKQQVEPVIKNISFSAKKGDIIGITGPVASGKSSLSLALLGFYDYMGSIKYNGKELRDYSDSEKSKLISYLGHNTELFSDTIQQNILLGEDLDVMSVLKTVSFEKDLENMEQGLETYVGSGGVQLSGGQQARLALARTLIRNRPFIILDDPFSAIDVRTEQEIIQNIRKNYPNSILIVISHRLSIFPMVNQIIFLQKDKSAEYGTHAELMESSPLYKTIYQLQNGQEWR